MSQLERKYLTAEDAAEHVGYTPNTLAQYRCRRIGPSFLKARARVLYAMEELDRWVESQAVLVSGAEVMSPAAQSDGPVS